MTFATVASFGFQSCWDACFQNVLKSGGNGQLMKKSQALPPDPALNSSIMAV